MMRRIQLLLRTTLLVGLFFVLGFDPAGAQDDQASLTVIDRSDQAIDRLTDGDLVRLRVRLAEQAAVLVEYVFLLPDGAVNLGSCRIEAGSQQCESPAFRALGWHWDGTATPQPMRTIQARAAATGQSLEIRVPVAPRPVVMVHGFSSNWTAWASYLGPDGYLATQGLAGYAVGDGQVKGVMNTGIISDPGLRTNTIAENAAILGQYIDQVLEATGAQQVDLVAHSMGGLISRYYIDRVMGERDVAQLLMLGSPMAGTDCANLPASLQLYLPASLEIQPSYVLDIFNPQITHRNGVPFHALAGVSILDPIQAPCTDTPTDIAVSRASVSAIPLDFSELPLLHTVLNISQEVFRSFVLPQMQTPAGQFAEEPDPVPSGSYPAPLQFTRIYTGHIAQGSTAELAIEIEPGLQVANFALFDTSRSLAVNVVGASGKVIELDPLANGLIVFDDPAALFYLGYGFKDPRPGLWKITLSATGATPPEGADYAIRARYQGGAALLASADNLLPRVKEAIELSARLELAGSPIAVESAGAVVQPLDGEAVTVDFTVQDGIAAASWRPDSPGLYTIAVRATGQLPDGALFERTSYLTVEAQPQTTSARQYTTVAVIFMLLCLVGILVYLGLRVLWRGLRARRT